MPQVPSRRHPHYLVSFVELLEANIVRVPMTIARGNRMESKEQRRHRERFVPTASTGGTDNTPKATAIYLALPPSLGFSLPPVDELERLCRRLHIRVLQAYGRCMTGEFPNDQPLEMMLTFGHEAVVIHDTFAQAEHELTCLFGRAVVVVEFAEVDLSFNPIQRYRIMRSARLLFKDTAA
jgi:hypothetical protein